MLSLERVDGLKSDSNLLLSFVRESNIGQIKQFLNKLGKLDSDFNEGPLLHLLNHERGSIRYLAVKNLAKLGNIDLLDKFQILIDSDKSSDVRREAASAIGRMRNKKTVPTLKKLLSDPDPEVVLQAIRGLLVFKEDNKVKSKLRKLKSHPNEIIREIVEKEFKSKQKMTDNSKHTESPDYMKNVVVSGNVRETLKSVPTGSIHLTFTSPPYYNARDYSIYRSYEEYLSFLEDVFSEVHRITKEGRFFVLNTSPIIIPRAGRQYSSKRYPIPYDIHSRLINMGWEFIDDIVWLKPEASAKNRNAGFLQHRKPLGYKPNACTESVMVYRKKTDKLIDWNIKQYPEDIIEESKINGSFESSNVWKIDPTFDKTHSAVFPLDLCNKVIKFYSFVGDLVFDPFAGSGTFGISAAKQKRHFFLTEINSDYIRRIQENFVSVSSNNVKVMKLKEFQKINQN